MSVAHPEVAASSAAAAPASRPIGIRPKFGWRHFSIEKRALWLAVAYVVLSGGLLAALLLQLRSEAITAAKRELSAFAQLTAGHTSEVLQRIEEGLKVAEVTLAVATDAGAANDESISAMLRDVAGGTRGLRDVFVLDAGGRVVYQASGKSDIGLVRADQPYFVQYREKSGLSFLVGAPVRRPAQTGLGEWFIPVTHAWRGAKGELLGVIVGTVEPQFFDKAWTFDSEIAGLRIALTGADGRIIMRRPFSAEMMDRALVDRPTLAQLALESAAGTLEATSPFDGRSELLAYRTVADYPALLTFVAQPIDVVLAGWWGIVEIVGSVWFLGSLALGALGIWLAREMKARGALESRYRTLFDSIPYPVILSDYETRRILAFNDATEQQYGWSAGETRSDGPMPRDSFLPDEFAVPAAPLPGLGQDAAVTLEGLRHRKQDGTMVDVEMTLRQIDYDGRPALLTVVVDISERLRNQRDRQAAEEQLRQSQKMDVLGQLTGGIAHDFNNILTVIMDNAEVLTDKGGTDPDSIKRLGRITDSAQRAEDLTRQMLAFSRKQPLRPRPTQINDLVVAIGKMLRRTLGAQIEIDSLLADDLWAVEIDRAQLETALVNLCLNARDAMPVGGHLLIETKNVTLGASDVLQTVDALPGDYVMLTVSDTGRGILPKDVAKVFEPFFTTKEDGKGSGLGLSMVYGFVKQSNGQIDVQSELDRGTSFKLYLPRFDGAFEESAVRKSQPAIGGTERMLVVEDDPRVRANVVEQLQSLGYAVSEAADGPAGLAALEAEPSPYDLLLTDVVMPGPFNGKGLADRVAVRWPTTKIVFMSGYTDDALSRHGQLDAGIRLLSKPFRKKDLALIVRQTLDGDDALTAT
ncbi:hypothetical protein BH11PSE3_BH11PSE3_24140 [soil metagenome]